MNFTYFTLSRLFEIRFVQRDQTLWCAGRNFGILVVKNYTFQNYIPGVQKKKKHHNHYQSYFGSRWQR